ncbi:MAG: prenyltransferase [Paludibacteraceae bacterium]|nr:prenyltransferase [Paludibacteraceae bacterium]
MENEKTKVLEEKYYHGKTRGLFFWIRNSRSIALPQSFLPALTATILCIGQSGFVWWLAVLAVLGVAIGHLGMNLADDYFDYLRDSRNRATLSSTSVRARMDKCSYLNNGHASITDLRNAIIVFLSIAGTMGAVTVIAQYIINGWQSAVYIIIYALLGLFFGLNYSGGPCKFCFWGLGELVIGLMFGPLLMLGVSAACTGVGFTWPMATLSVGIGFMVTNILYVHSVMEVKADAELDKMTFARLLPNNGVRLVFVGLFALIPFVLLGIGVALGWWTPWYLLTLVTLPMTIYLIVSLTRFTQGKPTNDNPRWWMGPMTEFQIFKEAGLDWFLIRWLLARNVVMYFCLIIMIVQIITLL